jgi:hypothetical protein
LALWFIFIDHVPGNRLGGFTLRNFALCDAAEAFVLLAGYAAGLAYASMLDRQGWLFAAAALLRRVGTLYIAHIFLFVTLTAQVGYSAAALDRAAYLDELHLDAFGEHPTTRSLKPCCCASSRPFSTSCRSTSCCCCCSSPGSCCCTGRGCSSPFPWPLTPSCGPPA